MARYVQESETSVSLFPFLSILACVIGVLILMIAALALGQINTPDEEEAVQRAEEYVLLKKKLTPLESRKADLKKRIDEAEAIQQELEQVRRERDQLKKLQEQMQSAEALKKEQDQLLAREQELKKRLAELELGWKKYQDQKKAVVQELNRRKLIPNQAAVRIMPYGYGSGSNVNLEPVFVETTEKAILVHGEDKPKKIEAAKMGQDAGFQNAIKQVKENSRGIMVFLVREDSYAVQKKAVEIARSKGVRTGLVPLTGKGRVDLGAFSKGG